MSLLARHHRIARHRIGRRPLTVLVAVLAVFASIVAQAPLSAGAPGGATATGTSPIATAPKDSVGEPAYRTGVFLETMIGTAGCRGVQLGHDQYWPDGDATCAKNANQAAYILLDGSTLKPVGLSQLTSLSGPDAGKALATALAPWQRKISDSQRYVVVLVAPPGCCANSVISAGRGASYVWNLSKNGGDPGASDPVVDLKNIATPAGRKLYGYKNEDRTIPSSPLVGDLAGFLQPVGSPANYWSFVPSDYLNYDTKVGESTLVTSWPAVVPRSGATVMLVSDGGLALTMPTGAIGSGSQATGALPQGTAAQQWRWQESTAQPGYFELINAQSALCLDVRGVALTGYLEQWDCFGNQINQLWKPVRSANGTYTLVSAIPPTSPQPPQVLTLDGPAGSTLHLQSPDGSAAQSWTVRAVAPFSPTVDHQIGVLISADGMALEPSAATSDSPLDTAAETDLAPQRWELVDDGTRTGTFELISVSTRLCADVFESSAAGALQTHGCKGSEAGRDRNNQLFQITARPDGSLLLASKVAAGVVLTAAGSAAGSALAVSADHGLSTQRWIFKPIATTLSPGDTGVLTAPGGQSIDYTDGVDYTTADPDQSLAAHPETDAVRQQFSFRPVPGTNGLMQIQNLASGQCLTSTTTTRGAAVPLATCAPSAPQSGQLWRVANQPGGSISIVNALTDLALAIGDVPTPPTPPADKRDQVDWPSASFTEDETLLGSEEVKCSDQVPAGESMLYPYLSPDGSNSYEYRLTGDITHVSANTLSSDLGKGRLDLVYRTSGGTLGVTFHCLSQLSANSEYQGLTVTSPAVTVWAHHATVTFSGQNGPGDCPGTNHCGTTLTPRVEWGSHYARYQKTDSSSAATVTSGDSKQFSVSLTTPGSAPGGQLAAGTTYHYRIRLERENGDVSYSDDLTFTTSPAPAPIVQQPIDLNADSQRWLFNPTQRALTMRLDGANSTAALPWSTAGFAVAGLATGGTVTAPVSFANTTDGDTAAARTISEIVATPGSAVVVQSINQPAVSPTPGWKALTDSLVALGGTENGFNALDGSGDYALVGCQGCDRAASGTAVEVNSVITSRFMPDAGRIDEISGQLALDGSTNLRSGSIAVGPGDPSRFLTLSYQRPSAWPVPDGVPSPATSPILGDILSYIAVQAGMTGDTCYQQDQDHPTPRADYCKANLPDVSNYTAPTGRGYTSVQFNAVRDEIAGEITKINNVASYVDAVETVFDGTATGNAVHNVVEKVRTTLLNNAPSATTRIDAAASVSAVLGILSFLSAENPAVAAVVGISSIGVGWLGGLGDADGGSAIDPVTVSADAFTSTWDARMKAARKTIGDAGVLLRLDYQKLTTADNYVKGHNPAARWDLSSTHSEISVAQNELIIAARSQAWNSLLPVAWTVYDLPASDLPYDSYSCTYITNELPHLVLHNEPASATFQQVRQANDGSVVHRWAVLGSYTFAIGATVQLPTAGLTDDLWQDPAGDDDSANVGLFKEWFFAEHPSTAFPLDPDDCSFPTDQASDPVLIKASAGSGQSTTVGTTFGRPLVARVTGIDHRPIAGVRVTFALPTPRNRAGAATFAGGRTTAVATTGKDGRATSPLITGTHAGAIAPTAKIPGASAVRYHLTVTAPRGVDLGVSVSAPATATSGSLLPVRIMVRNTGGNSAGRVQVNVLLPKGWTVQLGSESRFHNGKVSWTIPTLGSGRSVALRMTVRVAGIAGQQQVRAAVTPGAGETSLRDNLATATVRVT